MDSILHLIETEPRRFDAGEMVLEQGEKSHRLFFLIEGHIEVVKDGTQIATIKQPGAIFGELSVFLGGAQPTMVRALEPSIMHVIENPHEFLLTAPLVCLHVCELLARRLDGLNSYLVNTKEQFEGEGHVSLMGGILETLIHRHPHDRVRPELLNDPRDA
jgi:CRP/FNR family cyclic AMP-dependent transcriptional regulator